MTVNVQELCSKSFNQAQNVFNSVIHRIQNNKQHKIVEVNGDEVVLEYDVNGKLQKVLSDGKHIVEKDNHVIRLDMNSVENRIDYDLAMEIIRIQPAMKNNMLFHEVKENHYLLEQNSHNETDITVHKTPGMYVWWKLTQSLIDDFNDIDCEDPEFFWIQANIYQRDYLKKHNIISESTIQPDETDILLHYYKNELVEVIQKPGTYVFCNHKGQHVLIPVKTWQTCLKSQTTHPILAEYTKSIHLTQNQLLMVRKGLTMEMRLFDKAGDYYFWNLPGDDMTFDVIDCNQLIVSKEDRDILAPFYKDIKSKVVTMPNHWDEYHWRYLLADNKIFKDFAPDENVVWLWKNQSDEAGARFRMIPHLVQNLKLASQTVYTKDKTAVKVTVVIPYYIPEPNRFIQQSSHIFYNMECSGNITGTLEMELHTPLQMTLREIIQNYTIEEIIEKRQEIQTLLYNKIKPLEEQYGLAIQAVHLRDIILTKELQDILNQLIVAEKKAQIKSIERKDEVAANRSLINTSKLLEEHPGAFALRKLQTVETICEKIQTLHLNLGDQDHL